MIYEKIELLFSRYFNDSTLDKEKIYWLQVQYEVLFDFFRDELEAEVGSVNYGFLDDIYMTFDRYEPDENIRADDNCCIGEKELIEKVKALYAKIELKC